MNPQTDAGRTGIACARPDRPWLILLRYSIYFTAIIGLIFSTWLFVREQGMHALTEEGIIEYLGLILLGLTFLVFSSGFCRRPGYMQPQL